MDDPAAESLECALSVGEYRGFRIGGSMVLM
jgi:hypothetical protein